MTAVHVEPLSKDALPQAVALCTAGIRRIVGDIGADRLDLPSAPVAETADAFLRGYLDGRADGKRAWVVTAGDSVRAIAGAIAMSLTPDDPRYTYMPPRSVTIPALMLHADSASTAAGCYPLLIDAIRRYATTLGDDTHVLANVVTAHKRDTDAWHRLGLLPSSVMARRPVTTWVTPQGRTSDVRVRAAVPYDVEALTDLALEEHLHHAEHTSSGVSRDQPRATSRRLAADSVGAPDTSSRQLIAEDRGGKVLGSTLGTIQHLADDQIQRYLLPARYGYIGLTLVTASARGNGVGQALVDELMAWFHDQGVETVFLHYAADNTLSARFWTRARFTPHIEINRLPTEQERS